MAENKTIPTNVSPAAFIDQVTNEQRRKDCKAIVVLMRQATGHPPKMWGTSIIGFDRYRYRYATGREGENMITGFSPRKEDLVLYLGEHIQTSPLMARLGKHKTGKGCLYIKRGCASDHPACHGAAPPRWTTASALPASGGRAVLTERKLDS